MPVEGRLKKRLTSKRSGGCIKQYVKIKQRIRYETKILTKEHKKGMLEEIIIAGFGGQGVLSMGQTLGYAAMVEGQGSDLDAFIRT